MKIAHIFFSKLGIFSQNNLPFFSFLKSSMIKGYSLIHLIPRKKILNCIIRLPDKEDKFKKMHIAKLLKLRVNYPLKQ